ncbi:MAG: Uma2 family endonuclease [Oscillatoriales cyanobacterium SM2_1_8]|nr:Uma2 family endonuclease [Oscillatoriales cyanobacterium SM2_1_8]
MPTVLPTLTLTEFLQLPETKPASEYIDGQILPKPTPQGKHSTLQGELVAFLNGQLKPLRLARAFPELRCTFGDRSTVPDIAVFAWERIPRDANGEIANAFALPPDWTIEILSPEQRHTKVIKNILHSLQHGTQMGWLIDPEEQTVMVYTPQQLPTIWEEPAAPLPVPPFAQDLRLTVGEVFGWLMV